LAQSRVFLPCESRNQLCVNGECNKLIDCGGPAGKDSQIIPCEVNSWYSSNILCGHNKCCFIVPLRLTISIFMLGVVIVLIFFLVCSRSSTRNYRVDTERTTPANVLMRPLTPYSASKPRFHTDPCPPPYSHPDPIPPPYSHSDPIPPPYINSEPNPTPVHPQKPQTRKVMYGVQIQDV
ncbi:hypothetical protein PMAYCL1PPCAC_25107, partial [Pristionchus mayeri]